MARVTVYNMEGQPVEEMELSDRVFGGPVNVGLLHQAVITYLANQRAGTASTKTRAMVRGGGRKPWRQKGTGRARQGTIRAPHWRGGGVVFGPHPRSYHRDLPRKMRAAAIRHALSAKFRDGELRVVSELALPEIRTRQVVTLLKNLETGDNVLFVTAGPEQNLKLSARNLPAVELATANALNAYTLLKHHQVVLSKSAVEAIEGVFGNENGA